MTGRVIAFPGSDTAPEPSADKLIPENQVLIYRPALAKSLLRAARKALTITWTKGSRGSAWYRLADVDVFLKTREKQCQGPAPDPYSNLGDNGSPKSPAASGSTDSGMTQELVEHVAQASALRILKTQKPA